MSEEKAKELIGGIEDLPTLPEVVIEITRLVENPDTSAEDVYRIVSTDVSLSATMLKLVNSAFYGMSRSVTSLEQAIRILGFSTVRNIALAAFVFDAFLTGKGQFDYKGFWIHSIGTGATASVLSRRLNLKESGEYFVYGLLHDLGVVLFMQYLPDEFEEVQKMVESGMSLGDAERKVAGCTHGELGGALAERWDFPPPLGSVIRFHNNPDMPNDNRRPIAITSCANAIAQALDIGSGVCGKVPLVDSQAWQEAGLKPDQLGSIMDEVLDEMEESRSFIDLLYR